MRDVAAWSLPIGRFRGITVRVHLAFLIFSIAMVLRGWHKGYGIDALIMQVLLFGSVLLHEFGHCFAARYVDGDATDILMWPLGGLAYVDVPNTPRAHLITVLGGPFVNVVLCVASIGGLAALGDLPSPNPAWDSIVVGATRPQTVQLKDGKTETTDVPVTTTGNLYNLRTSSWFCPGFLDVACRKPDDAASSVQVAVQMTLGRLFWVNWILFLFNLLPAYPLDGGRIWQCILWPRVGFRQATMAVVYCGYVVGALLLVYALVMAETGDPGNTLLLFGLGLFIIFTCRQQAFLLETGALGEESIFGYDFSQGYSSLERDQPATRRRRPNVWQRWLQKRAALKRQKEEERRVAEESRVDELLAKVQQGGLGSLTDEERRFLTRVSARYRNKNQS